MTLLNEEYNIPLIGMASMMKYFKSLILFSFFGIITMEARERYGVNSQEQRKLIMLT